MKSPRYSHSLLRLTLRVTIYGQDSNELSGSSG